MNKNQLTFAREYRGMTQTELARSVKGLSQSNLSKFEAGIGELSQDVIAKIMGTLAFPMAFLDKRIGNSVTSMHFRKKARLKASERNMINRFVSVVAYVVDYLIEEFEVPPFGFEYIDVESGASPSEIAEYVRRKHRLGNGPLDNMCNFIERNGVFIYEWDCKCNDFDAVSLVSDSGNHVIVINKNMSNDRKRFSLAHELGHIIMHNTQEFFIMEKRDIENEANEFASEFLLPENGIKNSLYGLQIADLPKLKRLWGASMQSIIRKARTTGAINENRYSYLMIEMSRKGYRTNEPFPVSIDSPTVISDMIEQSTESLTYSTDELSDALALPTDIVKAVLFPKNNIIRMA